MDIKDYEQVTDEVLVKLVRTQDAELYREIIRRYQDKLMRYAMMLSGHQDNAADIVQETFIKAFVNLHGFDTNKKFSSWIYRITHNEAVNYLKKHHKETAVDDSDMLLRQIPSEQTVTGEYEKKEAAQALRQCLGRLPLKYSDPLVLFFIEEKTYDEISDILRIPSGTVGVHIRRGKQMMSNICINIKRDFYDAAR